MSFFALMRVKSVYPSARRKPMDATMLTTYCLCDDLLQAMPQHEAPPCQRHNAEVMTTALTAA